MVREMVATYTSYIAAMIRIDHQHQLPVHSSRLATTYLKHDGFTSWAYFSPMEIPQKAINYKRPLILNHAVK